MLYYSGLSLQVVITSVPRYHQSYKKKKERTEEKGDFKQLNPKGKEKIDVNGWQDMYENMSAEQYQWWGREKISCCHYVFPVDVGMESS